MRDYLIIGHGLAGAILSHFLMSRGKTVSVFDQPERNHSSSVAAGLYNPITGRKMVKTWLADELFPILQETYAELETKLQASFYHPIGIYRPFVDIAEQNDWDGKRADVKFKNFIGELSRQSVEEISLNDPHGGLHLNQSGYVDIPSLIEANKKFLIEHQSYEEVEYQENLLNIGEEGVSYDGSSYERVIYCNGLDASKSKYFEWLPFRPVKGEILWMEGEKALSKIYNRGIFILPHVNGKFKIGSTYQNQFKDLQPTVRGQKELLEKLSVLSSEDFQVIEAKAGVRPATKDRRPMIGKHPEYEHIYIFNGFGSKGVSLVPYFARNFVHFLEENGQLAKDVNIKRFIKEYHSNMSN